MALMVVKRWDAETRQDVDYNTDVTTPTEWDDTDIWDDEPAARLAAERYEAVVCPAFDGPGLQLCGPTQRLEASSRGDVSRTVRR